MKSIKDSLALFSVLSSIAFSGGSTALAATGLPSETTLTDNQEQLLIAEYCARVITQRSPLNIRLGPGTSYAAVDQIAKDRMVRVEERNNIPMNDPAWHWLRISKFGELDDSIRSVARGENRWVSSRYIGPGFSCPANFQ